MRWARELALIPIPMQGCGRSSVTSHFTTAKGTGILRLPVKTALSTTRGSTSLLVPASLAPNMQA